jgi:hypothetical protein
VQERELLRGHVDPEKARPGDIPAGPVEARHDAGPDWVSAIDEDDGNGCRRSFGRKRRGIGVSNDQQDLATNQIGRQRRQSIILLFRPAVFDHQIPALDVACFAQPPVEGSDPLREWPRGHGAQEADHRHRRLLRPRRQRPRSRASKKSDELAPPNAAHGLPIARR